MVRWRRKSRAAKPVVHRQFYRMVWAAAIGVYATLFPFQEEFGPSQPVFNRGSMSLAPLNHFRVLAQN